MKAPATITDGNSSSIPAPFCPGCSGSATSVEIIAANAPSAPFTMPERPPSSVQMSPTTHAAWSATGGLMCAMKANATDSGICAKQIVMPSSTSVFTKSTFSFTVHVYQFSCKTWRASRAGTLLSESLPAGSFLMSTAAVSAHICSLGRGAARRCELPSAHTVCAQGGGTFGGRACAHADTEKRVSYRPSWPTASI